jgi:hypothetical protein
VGDELDQPTTRPGIAGTRQPRVLENHADDDVTRILAEDDLRFPRSRLENVVAAETPRLGEFDRGVAGWDGPGAGRGELDAVDVEQELTARRGVGWFRS